MRTTTAFFFALSVPFVCTAQQEVDTAEVLARVRAGGRFEQSKWRRGDDGVLEMHYFADMGGEPAGPRFQPVLGHDLERGLRNSGVIGYLSLACHGPDDLLAMTDAEFHLGALGVDVTDVGLRQYLAVMPKGFEGARGRAEMFDRMLAIDLLDRRGCKPAAAELTAIAQSESPQELRDRATRAIGRLTGQTVSIHRERLSPEALNLPLNFDACVIVDHSRLPDMTWLTPLGSRLAALVTTATIEQAGGSISSAMCNGAQMMTDVVCELPFGVAHRFGNVRLDHSCIVITARNDAKMPVALSWQAAGEIEAEGWQGIEATEATEAQARDNPLAGGDLVVSAGGLQVTLGGGAGKPRPDTAKDLLLDTGLAIRAIVPKTSKLWPALRFLDLPAAMGGELRVTFGDPSVIVLMVQARDAEEAEEWAAMGKKLLTNLRTDLEQQMPEQLRESKDIQPLLAALFAASFSVKDSAAFAVVELAGVTPAKLRAIAEVVAVQRF